MASVAKLADKVRDPEVSLPPLGRLAMLEMAEQIDVLSDRIERLGQEIQAGVNADETARRLTSIPGVGPLMAATVRATINDIEGFFDAALTLQRREGEAGVDLKAGQSSAQNPAGRWRLVNHQASEARRSFTRVVDRIASAKAIQASRSRAR